MARNEEKAQGLMNRWTQMKIDMAAPQRGKRPYLASECDNLSDCEYWRRQIVKEVQKLVGDIQNAGLGEHALRDMNDEINKKLREKRHWERQIKKLGGPNYGVQQTIFDAEGRPVRAGGGYLYFGATKDLPGVRELFKKEAPKKKKRSRRQIFRNINADYYGYRDEDDGQLLKAEKLAEQKIDADIRQQEAENPPEQDQTDAADPSDSKKARRSIAQDSSGISGDSAQFSSSEEPAVVARSHVPVPDQEAIAKLILARRRMELLAKYASTDLQKGEQSAKSLLNVKR